MDFFGPDSSEIELHPVPKGDSQGENSE